MSLVRALVVDDSGFFRRRIVDILAADQGIEVVGTAANGREALVQLMTLKPDVVTMDIEMPVMDGITAVRRLMEMRPTPVLMFSSLTHDGAQATLDALDAGAMDFLPKRFEDMVHGREAGQRLLCDRVRALGKRGVVRTGGPVAAPPPSVQPKRAGRHQLVAIGCSTGGPVALQRILTALPGEFRLPLVVVQHMPASFTPAFAERLDRLCAIRVKEAADGDVLQPGLALVAPGGRQMILQAGAAGPHVRIGDGPAEQHYRPSVDVTFSSVADVMPGRALGIVLTGMGADGREGARRMHQGGAELWAQDEASCVVYGMPAALVQAGLANRVMPLDDIGPDLARCA